MRRLLPLLPLLLLCAVAAPALADDEPAAPEPDTIVLLNGSVWTGRIIKEDDSSVVLESASRGGGVGRVTFPRSEIKEVRRASGAADAPDGGPRPIRREWFLLRRDGRIVGTRRLELWSVQSRGEPGFRLEERTEFFAQGPQLPAARSQRTEEVDLRFMPRLLAWHEEGERGEEEGGVPRYTRDASGKVVDGVWRGTIFSGGVPRRVEVRVPEGSRGRLGLREHLLRIPRRVRLLDETVIDPNQEGVVSVRAGFASVTEDPSGRRPGHEFHWEEGGRRLISFFDEAQGVIREEIGEGLVALPVTREQAEAARASSREVPEEEGREVRLAEAGVGFALPDATWTWQPVVGSPGHTGWRLLGRADNRVLLGDVRVEWHPRAATAPAEDSAQAEAWLLGRLRGVSPDLRVLEERRPLPGVEGAWRVDVQGTLKHESVRSTAVVVDRAAGRVVLLLAGPAGAWGQVGPALERILASLRLL